MTCDFCTSLTAGVIWTGVVDPVTPDYTGYNIYAEEAAVAAEREPPATATHEVRAGVTHTSMPLIWGSSLAPPSNEQC